MLWRRIFRQLFKRYQLILLEPHGGKTVRNIRFHLAGALSIVIVISLCSAALAWFYAPQRNAGVSARYYQLQQQNHALHNQIATFEGELAVASEQIDGLKNELLTSQQENEELRQSKTIYESILEARKASGVRILRASANMEEGKRLNYNIVLVKGGNYPRSVSGSVQIMALGSEGQQKELQAGPKGADIPYRMDTHAFLEGNVIWDQEWLPVKLQITRMNYQGAERDNLEIDIE